MVSFTTIFTAAAVAAGALAAPTATTNNDATVVKRSSPNSTGTSGGYYYQFWTDGAGGNTNYQNGNAGQFSVQWQTPSDFTSGKGWQQAKARNITFSGTISSSGAYYLAAYTWTQQGENYILEDYGEYNPCNDKSKPIQHHGTITSDGSIYDVCLVDRGNNYLQNWSIRRTKRQSGTITTANHYNYYASQGMNHNPLSAAHYQIMSVEAFRDVDANIPTTGSATMTVSGTN